MSNLAVLGLVGLQPMGPLLIDVDYLVIGGGGTGGGYWQGGGGAGGMLTGTFLDVAKDVSLNIVVGVGGLRAFSDGNGGDTVLSGISTITAYGGGKGGDEAAGNAGGSGGGAGLGGPYAGGSGVAGQGHAGQATTGYSDVGGGGGAGEIPTGDWQDDFPGGDGLASSITGTSTYYAGGGGGGFPGEGGAFGPGGLGSDNYGGGGSEGDSGMDGVVILRYPSSFGTASSTTGSPIVTTPTGFYVYKFTGSGSITF